MDTKIQCIFIVILLGMQKNEGQTSLAEHFLKKRISRKICYEGHVIIPMS